MKKLVLALFMGLSFGLNAQIGDTMHVKPLNQITVVTNPGTGSNGYKGWGVFPDTSKHVRKIIVTLNYKCAPGMNCGAWDYIDNLYLRRLGGVNHSSQNTEIVRFITPYGGGFNRTTWGFSWHMDVTDYTMFLHDSVEVEYVHGGYEGTNVGWQVTVDFAVINGDPIANPISFNQLWNGSFNYGDTAHPIQNYLTPDTIMIDPAAVITKIRTIHTGHGEDTNNCSEFCPTTRTIKIDGNIVSTRNRWRTCGDNALYPQAGSWIYDRANWCPGSIVQPDFVLSTTLTPGNKHSFEFVMPAYTGGMASNGNGFAYEAIDAQLFQYKGINRSIDASIEEVYQPSNMPEYSRRNPACDNPRILVRNNGSTVISSLDIKYGLKGSSFQTYTWNGTLNFADTATVLLPNISFPSTTTTSAVFQAYINNINGGQTDQYHYDDTAKVQLTNLPPIYDTTFMVYLNCNNNLEDSYYVIDAQGNVVHSRLAANLQANFVYKDTLHLLPGCYTLVLYDTGGDGLNTSFNTAQGQGAFMLRKIGGVPGGYYYKVFNPDFGSFTQLSFFAVPHAFATSIQDVKNNSDFNMAVFPNPTMGKAVIEYNVSQDSHPTLFLFNALGQQLMQTNLISSEKLYETDLSSLSNGFYYLKLQTEQGCSIKKIIKE
ncbi:MAG: peptide-N-glycosidase F-related protein [Bacteroidia bacterium]